MTDVLIIGAGFSGLGVAALLDRAGIRSFRILEGAADLGGTRRDNTYPGCACVAPAPAHIVEERAHGRINRWSTWMTDTTRIDFPHAALILTSSPAEHTSPADLPHPRAPALGN
jgi:cation diffusion facilitator CzcD-associated flavoprotein CzcO